MKTFGPGLVLLSALAFSSAGAQAPASPQVAATPPMGWNSWDSYRLTITEDQFRANVKVLATELKPFGYTYAVIDEGWFFFNPEARDKPDTLHYALDGYGRYVPVPARFPTAQSAKGELPPPRDASASAATPKLAATIQPASFKALGD